MRETYTSESAPLSYTCIICRQDLTHSYSLPGEHSLVTVIQFSIYFHPGLHLLRLFQGHADGSWAQSPGSYALLGQTMQGKARDRTDHQKNKINHTHLRLFLQPLQSVLRLCHNVCWSCWWVVIGKLRHVSVPGGRSEVKVRIYVVVDVPVSPVGQRPVTATGVKLGWDHAKRPVRRVRRFASRVVRDVHRRPTTAQSKVLMDRIFPDMTNYFSTVEPVVKDHPEVRLILFLRPTFFCHLSPCKSTPDWQRITLPTTLLLFSNSWRTPPPFPLHHSSQTSPFICQRDQEPHHPIPPPLPTTLLKPLPLCQWGQGQPPPYTHTHTYHFSKHPPYTFPTDQGPHSFKATSAWFSGWPRKRSKFHWTCT